MRVPNDVLEMVPHALASQGGHMKASVVERVTVSDVLRYIGAVPPRTARALIRCPLAGHRDSTASFRVFERGFRCFGCGQRGGILDFIVRLELAQDRASAARWLECNLL
jgi:hypothetical protein